MRRLYIQAAAPPFSPSAVKGTWNDSANLGNVGSFGTVPGGTANTIAKAEAVATNPFDVLLAIWTIRVGGAQLISGTVQWIFGLLESGTAAVFVPKVHIYVSQQNSSNVRGTLLNNFIGVTTFPTTATGEGEGVQNLTAVNAQEGDFVVAEVGYRKTGTSATSQTGTINYGNTGAPDLTQGDTNVTTRPGWMHFSQDFVSMPPPPTPPLRPAIFTPG